MLLRPVRFFQQHPDEAVHAGLEAGFSEGPFAFQALSEFPDALRRQGERRKLFRRRGSLGERGAPAAFERRLLPASAVPDGSRLLPAQQAAAEIQQDLPVLPVQIVAALAEV